MSDPCWNLWDQVYQTKRFAFPPYAKVLEIGCAELDWIGEVLLRRPDVQMTGIDWRACDRKGLVIQGDVLAQDFGERSFDCIVGISSIEHIGLGHYNDDPADGDGDRRTVERAARWLKPGGWIYLDVPYDPTGYRVDGTKCRVYDDAALQERFVKPFNPVQWQTWYGTLQGHLVAKPTTAGSPFHYVALWMQKAA